MKAQELLHARSPIGRRRRHPVMDTDKERDHEFFFIMTFENREQCDRSVDYILPHDQPGDASHKTMYLKVADPIFICWEDIE